MDKIFRKIKIAFFFALLLPLLAMPGSHANNGVIVLMYHAVNDNILGEEQLFVKPAEFYNQIKYLSDNSCTPITFVELSDYKAYKNPVMITFDDGYIDNYFYAYPILKEFNFKATIFIVAGFINKPGYLSEAQIKEMSDIISFQCHTLTHPELDTISNEELEKECIYSKQIIEAVTKEPIIAFSYPFGRYNQNVLEIVSSHYTYAVTTNKGVYNEVSDKYKINRINITRSFKLSDFIWKIY